MKKFQFAFLICIPLFWIIYKLIPGYINPAGCSTANFIYAENFEHIKIWCFDKSSNIRFDDSSNFLYTLSLWFFIHFFKISVFKAAIYVNGISLFLSIYLLHKIIDSRFTSIQLLIVGLLFMSTQLWAGILGDEIIFQGMLWLFVARVFWQHNYFWLMVWSVVNIIARPDNIFILLPLIIVSYWDISELKDRYKRKFIFRRIRRTVGFFLFPVIGYFTYRYFYFGKIMPYNWYHHTLDIDKKFGVFNNQGFYFGIHYIRFYLLPLVIGVLFYFIKERKSLSIRYYAIAFSFLVIPFVYNCTYSQDENLGFKNQYAIFLGLIILTLLFIRNFRSLSQGFAVTIFILFFGFKSSFICFQKALQSDKDNFYYIANDLAEIKNGKAIVFYDNHLTWLSNWQVIFGNGKHTKDGEDKTSEIMNTTTADIIVQDNFISDNLLEKYDKYSIPTSTRMYEKETEPDNSIDKFFYKNTYRYKLNNQQKFTILIWKFGNNYTAISSILEKHGGKRIIQ